MFDRPRGGEWFLVAPWVSGSHRVSVCAAAMDNSRKRNFGEGAEVDF
jgi:hypothetical protein